jgi:hypothetical protein
LPRLFFRPDRRRKSAENRRKSHVNIPVKITTNYLHTVFYPFTDAPIVALL